MFEEDPQWGPGSPNPFVEELHQKLFGGTGIDAPFSSKKKEKRKRKRNETDSTEDESCKRERRETSAGVSGVLDEARAQEQSPSQKKLRKSISFQGHNGAHSSKQADSSPSPQYSLRKPKNSKLYSKLSTQLEGSRFRMINQQLYTTTGEDAKLVFDEDPELFNVYHRGFATQVAKWPENPIDRVIARVQTLPEDTVVCDFGCGEAKLAESVKQRVHSFDLVAINERVTVCDMAHVPLKRHTVDVCVFCLSLMGTNVSDFIREARRVVRKGGEMRIYEVSSRFPSFDVFVKNVEAFGFKLVFREEFSKMFVEFVFTAVTKQAGSDTDLPLISLKPCVYKRR